MEAAIQVKLKEKLWVYIVDNNPEVVLALQESTSVFRFLEEMVAAVWPLALQLLAEEKPQYIVEELCLENLTHGLKPSRFLYIRNILEEEFAATYEHLREAGVLTYETVNLIAFCDEIFESFSFTIENEDDPMLRYAIVGQISGYLD